MRENACTMFFFDVLAIDEQFHSETISYQKVHNETIQPLQKQKANNRL